MATKLVTFLKQILAGVVIRSSIFAIAVMTPAATHAIVIDFETTSGYSLGDVKSQPSNGTKWTGSSSEGFITSDGSTQFLQMAAYNSTPAINTYSSIVFSPTSLDLGGTSTIYSFSFDLKSIAAQNPSSTGYAVSELITLAGQAIRIEVWEGGSIQFYSGSNKGTFKDGSGNAVDLDNYSGFNTISGVVNTSTQTYTLYWNGIQQNVSGNTSLALRSSITSLSDFTFSMGGNSTSSTNYRQLGFDNISLAAIPEPPVYFMFVASAVFFGLFFGRRKASFLFS